MEHWKKGKGEEKRNTNRRKEGGTLLFLGRISIGKGDLAGRKEGGVSGRPKKEDEMGSLLFCRCHYTSPPPPTR